MRSREGHGVTAEARRRRAKWRAWLALAALAWSLLDASPGAAFVLIGPPFRKWLDADIPGGGVVFLIDNRGEDSVTVADGSADNGLTQVSNAVQLWNEAAGRSLVAAPILTAITSFNTTDGLNSLVFNDPLGICTGSCLAATFVGRYDTGSGQVTNGITFAAYTETDITFNASANWTTNADAGGPGCAGEFDIEGVSVHEMGHALGVGHSDVPTATMYAFTSSCTPAGIPLDPDDVAAVRCAYVDGLGCAGCTNCPAVPPPTVFACGSDFGGFSFTVSMAGNLVRLESPSGFEHVAIGAVREGPILCYTGGAGPAMAFDITDQAGGFLGASISQPNGPGTLPLEVMRQTTDGLVQLRQRYTGNSFVVPGGGPSDLNGNGLLCDSLAECGNCTNRTVHVLMEVTNRTGATLNNVVLVRVADLDVDGQPTVNRFSRTADSVVAWRDGDDSPAGHGVIMQGILGPAPVEPLVQTVTRSSTVDCAADSTATPVLGDLVGKLRWPLGTLAPGETKQVRMHYRRW